MRYLTVFLLLYLQFSFSQEKTQPRFVKLTIQYTDFASREAYGSISKLLFDFEALPDLIPIEKQMLYLCKGDLSAAINNPIKSLKQYKKSISFYDKSISSRKLYGIGLARISDFYFTEKSYKEAYLYAIKAKPIIPKQCYYEYVNIHSIIGYYYYLNKNYDKSLMFYGYAEKLIIEEEDFCKLPEMQAKEAKILNAKGNFNEAIFLINKVIKQAADCKDIINIKSARITKAEILTDNNQLRAALIEKDSVTEIEKRLNSETRNKKIDSLEVVYKTKIKEQQNESLKKINTQKENDIQYQKKALIGTFIGLGILSVLLYFVFKLSKKQKQTNQELEIQKQKIEEANVNLERINLLNQKIFSVISHDFKEPMLSMEVLLKMDEKNNLDPEVFNKNKERIKNKLKQANLIMDNLLNWAKEELGIGVNNEVTSNVYQITEEVMLQLEALLNQKQLIVINEIPTSNTLSISPDILKIIFRNIFSNAIKYSFECNNIIAGYNDVTNEYYIQDFGIGMNDEQLQLIFSNQVVSKIGTNQETGFGIGLNFVYELIHKHNGTIRAESTLNEGTTILFL